MLENFENNNNTTSNNYDDFEDEFTYGKQSVRRKKLERKIRKKRKKINSLKAFLRFLVTVLLLVGCYFILKLPQWYLPSDTFKKPADNIEIMNNKIIPDYVIYNSLKDVKVKKLPIFFVSVRPIMRQIYKLPVIKKVYVRRYGFPARLQIIVRERTPIALIKTNLKAQPVAFLTSDGVLVTNKRYMNVPDKDVLKILTTPKGMKNEVSVKKIKEIEHIVKDVETYSNEKVEYIDIRNPNDVFVKIHTINIRLGVLDSTVYERIKRIYTILPQIADVDSKIQYIDLSWDKVNYLKLQKVK